MSICIRDISRGDWTCKTKASLLCPSTYPGTMTSDTAPSNTPSARPRTAAAPDSALLDLEAINLADPLAWSQLAAFGHAQRAMLVHYHLTIVRLSGTSYGEAVQTTSCLFGLSRRRVIHVSSTVASFLHRLEEIGVEIPTPEEAALRAYLRTMGAQKA